MSAMKRLLLLPIVFAAACSDQPTKQESTRIFATTMPALQTAQTNSVTIAKNGNSSSDVTLNYSGACSLGGTVAVNGNYSGSGTDDHATFDLTTAFHGCKEIGGSLDGDIHWASSADAAGFKADLDGSVDWASGNDSATCDFDMHLAVSATAVSYTGSLCGYAMADLGITTGH